MEDLEIIRKIMDQHKVLADQINFTTMTLSDKDALLVLEKAQADLAVDFRRSLKARRDLVIESLTLAEKGLKNHYDFEEQMLPPLLGQLLTQGLIIEHKDLMAEMRRVISLIGNIDLKGLSRADEITQEAIMSESLSALRSKKSDHQKREEAMLQTLLYICEEKAKNPNLREEMV